MFICSRPQKLPFMQIAGNQHARRDETLNSSLRGFYCASIVPLVSPVLPASDAIIPDRLEMDSGRKKAASALLFWSSGFRRGSSCCVALALSAASGISAPPKRRPGVAEARRCAHQLVTARGRHVWPRMNLRRPAVVIHSLPLSKHTRVRAHTEHTLVARREGGGGGAHYHMHMAVLYLVNTQTHAEWNNAARRQLPLFCCVLTAN